MHEISPHAGDGTVIPTARYRPPSGRFETKVLVIPPGTRREDHRRMIARDVENGSWELARVVVYRGGVQKVWLRRRVISVLPTR